MLEAILATEPVIRNRHRWTPALLQHHFGARAQITEHQLPNEALNLADGTSPASKSAPPQKSYVHLNPARAGLLKGGQPLEEFPWSSYGDYLRPARQRPAWLRVDRLLGEKGIPRDSAAGRREFARLTEQRRRADLAEEFKPVEGAGAWAARSFDRNFWRRWRGRCTPPTMAPNGGKCRRTRRWVCCGRKCGAWDGMRKHCAGRPRGTRGKSGWPRGSEGKPP